TRIEGRSCAGRRQACVRSYSLQPEFDPREVLRQDERAQSWAVAHDPPGLGVAKQALRPVMLVVRLKVQTHGVDDLEASSLRLQDHHETAIVRSAAEEDQDLVDIADARGKPPCPLAG